MHPVDPEVDRLLTLLRNTIHARGFTQLEVQEAIGWGRSYISQLLTKQKKIRIDQVLLILNVLGYDPAVFFAELYQARPHYAPVTPTEPGQAEEQKRELQKLRTLLDSLVGLLLEKKLMTSRDLRAAAAAAEREEATEEG